MVVEKQARLGQTSAGKNRKQGNSPDIYGKTTAPKEPIKMVRSSSTGPNYSMAHKKQGQFTLKIPPVQLNEDPEIGKRLRPFKRSEMVQAGTNPVNEKRRSRRRQDRLRASLNHEPEEIKIEDLELYKQSDSEANDQKPIVHIQIDDNYQSLLKIEQLSG